LGAIIGQFKSIVTKRINAKRQTPGALVWQRNYYEHIIRNESDLDRIRRYIVFNPALWDKDENNPTNLIQASGVQGFAAANESPSLRHANHSID
jgi:hypothetical protein